MTLLKELDRILLLVGVALLGFCVVVYLDGAIHAWLATRAFELQVTNAGQTSLFSDANKRELREGSPSVDRQLLDYGLGLGADPPIALLRIPRLGVEVPVFDSTDRRMLNRGVGRIAGTARPGENGNVGIAGHRDRFFRPLRNIEPADTLQLITNSGTYTYVVDSLQIVSPDDVNVLKNESTPSLTLVTCYPFFFVGSAPRRFIAHASLEPSSEITNNGATVVRSTNATFQENAR